MTLFAEYVKERFNHETIEDDDSFVTYSLNPPNAQIEEFYIKKDYRGTLKAKRLTDKVFQIAKENGCTHVWSRVQPGAIGAEHSLRSQLTYGFKLMYNNGIDTITCKKIED